MPFTQSRFCLPVMFAIFLLSSSVVSGQSIQRILDFDLGRSLEFVEPEDPGEDEAGELIDGAPEDFPDDLSSAVDELDCSAEDHDHVVPAPLNRCQRATKKQRAYVNLGVQRKDSFLAACFKATRDSTWCLEVLRPNPESRKAFACTYGWPQPHILIHPDQKTWKFAFEAIKIADELFQKGIHVCAINNWWRPEPYNKNVGGAKGRHPLATSVDVRFCTKADQVAAFDELCQMRAAGRVRAIGFYPGTVLHFGIGDGRGNTWGKACSALTR